MYAAVVMSLAVSMAGEVEVLLLWPDMAWRHATEPRQPSQ
jgi:hypothetical protein